MDQIKTKYKIDPVSGMYMPAKIGADNLSFMRHQPKRSNAVGHCSNAMHHGFLSRKMIKEHECKKKNCRFFKTIEQFELDAFRKKKKSV